MFFCPNCNNSFDISREIVQTGGSKNHSEVIELILNSQPDELIKNSIQHLNMDSFNKSVEFKKLESSDKELIINKIQDLLPHDKKDLIKNKTVDIPETNIAYFVCKNCIFNIPIKDNTLLYSKTSGESQLNDQSDNIDILIHSKILPITRKYICPNKKCESHKDFSKKEAIIYRNRLNFYTKYICKTCKTYWNV